MSILWGKRIKNISILIDTYPRIKIPFKGYLYHKTKDNKFHSLSLFIFRLHIMIIKWR